MGWRALFVVVSTLALAPAAHAEDDAAEDNSLTGLLLRLSEPSTETPRKAAIDRARAAEQLASLRDPKIEPALRRQMAREQDDYVILALHYALAAHGDRASLRFVVEALPRKSFYARLYLGRLTGLGVSVNAKQFAVLHERFSDAGWRRYALANPPRAGAWPDTMGQDLQRRGLPARPLESCAKDLQAATAWWDRLGFPDVTKLPAVRVTGPWMNADEKSWDPSVFAFLVSEDDDSFTVFDTELDTKTYPRDGKGDPMHARFERVQVDKAYRAALERLDRLDVKRTDIWHADTFGADYFASPRLFKALVLARAALARGHVELALEIWEYSTRACVDNAVDVLKHSTERRRKERLARLFDDPTSTWAARAKAYATWVKRFGGSFHRWDEVLAQQVAEAPRYAKTAEHVATLTDPDARARAWVFALPSERSAPRGEARSAVSPVRELVRMGKPAVPALIGALQDLRFTQGVSSPTARPLEGARFEILRVRDLALRALNKISGRDLARRTAFDEIDWTATRAAVKAWWDAEATAPATPR